MPMRAITATVLLALSVPSVASASELKLLDTKLVLTARPQPGPFEAREKPTWTAGTTVFSLLTVDIALVASLAVGVLGGLVSAGSAGQPIDTSFTVGFLMATTSALFLMPGAVVLTASGYDLRPSYGWMLLGNVFGLAAGGFICAMTESVYPMLIVPAALVTAIGAATAEPIAAEAPRPRFERPAAPPRPPPPTEEQPEYEDEEDDEYYSAAPAHTPRTAHIDTVPRPVPRAFVLPVVALRF